MLPVFLLVGALIVYGSLYPWDFHRTASAAGPWIVLLHSWPKSFDRYIFKDIAVNVALYLPFGAAGYLWLSKLCLTRRVAWLKIAAPVILAVALSCSMEMTQLYDDGRVCSLLDVATNLVGASLGVWFGSRLREVKAPHLSAGPLFLLSCWAGALLFPFMPDLSRTHLWQKLATFASAPVTSIAFLSAVATWMAAERLMDITGFRWLYILLPIRFFVTGISLTWADCAAAGLAWLISRLLSRLTVRDAIVAVVVLAAVILNGLAPFHFSARPQDFSWIPFRALLNANWEAAFTLFLRKSFLYGSAVWLLRRSGLTLWTSAALVAAVLASIEAAQLYLPNHVAESTDPLHALIMAWILGALARNEKPAKRVC